MRAACSTMINQYLRKVASRDWEEFETLIIYNRRLQRRLKRAVTLTWQAQSAALTWQQSAGRAAAGKQRAKRKAKILPRRRPQQKPLLRWFWHGCKSLSPLEVLYDYDSMTCLHVAHLQQETANLLCCLAPYRVARPIRSPLIIYHAA